MGKGKRKGRANRAKNRIKAIRGGGKIGKKRNENGEGPPVNKYLKMSNSYAPEKTVGEGEVEWAQHEPEEYKQAPHSFIIGRGKVGRYLRELKMDMRKVMEPYTASKLKEREGNNIRDYVSIASYFHVSHILGLSRTSISPYLKICKIPRGPSLTFRVLTYTLARDVLASLKKQVTYPMQYHHHPLLIMNNFADNANTDISDARRKALGLVTSTFQNMFPPINVSNVKVKEIRRVLMLNYNAEDDTIDLRHYTITYKQVGVSRSIKKLLLGSTNKIPNLNKITDISDYLLKKRESEAESEAEEISEAVPSSDKLGRGTKGAEEIAIRLVELGPRLKLQLIKVEEGLLDGEILYHKVVTKTEEEKLAIRKSRQHKMRVKEQRRRIQERNVKKKHDAKAIKKKRLRRQEQQGDYDNFEPDNDREWYRQEVGQEPDD